MIDFQEEKITTMNITITPLAEIPMHTFFVCSKVAGC